MEYERRRKLIKLEKETRRQRFERSELYDPSLSVQAFINNISFPETIEELEWFIYEHGCFNVEDVLYEEKTNWTVPKWAKAGDIVFFMHSKTAISKITALRTQLNKTKDQFSKEEYGIFMEWINIAIHLYKEFGGKIFAIGRVSGNPVYEAVEDNDLFHWKSRLYGDINGVIQLTEPVDISEFNSFILVSRGGAITGVFGEQFERLRAIIEAKNPLPRYVRDSVSIPIPLRKINRHNWIELAGQYRRSFFLEIQFRSFYVDYLLSLLGDKRKIYRECRCTKSIYPDSFVDNVILLNGKYLPIEVKLYINAEKNLKGQVVKYTNVDKCYLIKKSQDYITSNEMYGNHVLVIDTFGIYVYEATTDNLSKIYDLDNLKTEKDIKEIKAIILSIL